MPHTPALLVSILLLTFLAGCGGGGGSSTPQTTNFPLRTGVMNVYGVAWQKSGYVTGSEAYVCYAPTQTNPTGFCDTPITGTFTNTVTPGAQITLGGVSANLISVSRVSVTSVTGGSTASYQVAVKSDFSAIVDASGCTLPIPETVSIGYTAILSCPNGVTSGDVTLSVTADTLSNSALITTNSAYGKEIYRLSSTGSVTPISVGPFSGKSNNGYGNYSYTLYYY